MDTCSYFLDNKAMFGSYPTQDTVGLLELLGVRFFIDLTCKNENKIIEYKTNYTYINFPIKDNGIPDSDEMFIKFIYKLMFYISDLKDYEKMYIHCKGGHGRSGIVVACLHSCLFYKNAEESLRYTNFCHSNRHTMRDIWRKKGSPQTHEQKNYVKKLCRSFTISNHNPLSLYSNYGVRINNETFNSAIEAINKFIYIYNRDVEKTLKKVILNRFYQHKFLQNNLVNTGIRQIHFKENTDEFSRITQNIFNKYRFKLFNII